MENNIQFEELQELRMQLTLLNNKLEKQEIINERLIKNLLKEKISVINRTGITMAVCALIATPICAYNFHYILHISLALNIFTCVFMAIAVVYTIWSHKGLNNNVLAGDLISVNESVLRTRKRYKQWYYFSYPWLAVWLGWFGWELYTKAESFEILIACIIGCLVGGLIGGIWGIRQRNKIYKNIDDILAQIEELKKEN